MILSTVPAIVMIVGLLVYVLANGKASEAGRITFAAALLVLLMALAGSTIRLG